MTMHIRKRSLLPLALCLALRAAFAAEPAPPAETPQERWNLSDLYQSRAAYDADVARFQAQLKDLSACAGDLGDTPARFKACLDLKADAGKRLDRLSVYATVYFQQDTADSVGGQLNQQAGQLEGEYQQAAAFLPSEVLALGAARVHALLSGDASLAMYGHELDKILRAAPHTLDASGAQLLAQYSPVFDTSYYVFQALSGTEMPWPKLTLADGSTVVLNQSAYSTLRQSPNRAERKQVFDAYWGQWKAFERSYGAALNGNLQSAAADAKVHRYPDSLSAALDADNIPPEVYRTLIAQANANLPTLHRYFRLRARLQGLKDAAYYDIYTPLIDAAPRFPLAQGKQLMLEAVAPLGKDYVAALRGAVDARWMDAYPRPHKTPGAQTLGDAYDVHPYVLMNYSGDYLSLSTLTHEWGHAMHTVLTRQQQDWPNTHHSSFLSEIASTTNEALLLDHMLKSARSDDERLAYLGAALESMRSTFFRQTMLAEFEAAIHARVDQGESLTGQQMSAIYGAIMKRYHGEAEGVMTVDPAYSVEWASVLHFYSLFYVFRYATSLAAAQDFSQRILNNEPGAREAYLHMLGAGGADYPYELIKAAGVDLASPQPYQALAARMNAIMDQIETIAARRGK